MASEIEAASGIPSFGLDTKGLAYYGKGIYDATAALMKRFAGEKTDTVERSVNTLE